MTPEQTANAILDGAERMKCDLRSALDLPDEAFDALVKLAGEYQPVYDRLTRDERAQLRAWAADCQLAIDCLSHHDESRETIEDAQAAIDGLFAMAGDEKADVL